MDQLTLDRLSQYHRCFTPLVADLINDLLICAYRCEHDVKFHHVMSELQYMKNTFICILHPDCENFFIEFFEAVEHNEPFIKSTICHTLVQTINCFKKKGKPKFILIKH